MINQYMGVAPSTFQVVYRLLLDPWEISHIDDFHPCLYKVGLFFRRSHTSVASKNPAKAWNQREGCRLVRQKVQRFTAGPDPDETLESLEPPKKSEEKNEMRRINECPESMVIIEILQGHFNRWIFHLWVNHIPQDFTRNFHLIHKIGWFVPKPSTKIPEFPTGQIMATSAAGWSPQMMVY